MNLACAYYGVLIRSNGKYLEQVLEKINDHLIITHHIQPSDNLTVTATEDSEPLFFVKVVNT